jgi:hypothetical protein
VRPSLQEIPVLYLIDYDAGGKGIVGLHQFGDDERLRALYEKSQLELNLVKRGLLLREVVLIEARDLSELQRLHGRYFQPGDEPLLGAWPLDFSSSRLLR